MGEGWEGGDGGAALDIDSHPTPAPPHQGEGSQPPLAATPFDGIPLESSRKRLAGWSAERQKLFLTVLAETGQVHLAAAAARLSVRSAQRCESARRRSTRAGGWPISSAPAGSRRSPSIARSTAASSRSTRTRPGRGAARAERQDPAVAARPLDPALRPALGAARRCRPPRRGRRGLQRTARRLGDVPS